MSKRIIVPVPTLGDGELFDIPASGKLFVMNGVLCADYVAGVKDAPADAIHVAEIRADGKYEVQKELPAEYGKSPHEWAGWPKADEALGVKADAAESGEK